MGTDETIRASLYAFGDVTVPLPVAGFAVILGVAVTVTSGEGDDVTLAVTVGIGVADTVGDVFP